MALVACRKGANGEPCGNARRGQKTSEQCPRCWINLHTIEELKSVKFKLPPQTRPSARASIPIKRRAKCIHLGKRSEFRAGCGGWMCKHECDLGEPAVPGGYCQTCPKYEADHVSAN